MVTLKSLNQRELEELFEFVKVNYPHPDTQFCELRCPDGCGGEYLTLANYGAEKFLNPIGWEVETSPEKLKWVQCVRQVTVRPLSFGDVQRIIDVSSTYQAKANNEEKAKANNEGVNMNTRNTSAIKNTATKIVDTIINIAKRPFKFLDAVQEKLGEWAEDTKISWCLRKISQVGKLLTNKKLVASILGVSMLKLTQLRSAIKALTAFMKKYVGKLPVLGGLISLMETLVSTVFWTVDKLVGIAESVGIWILTKVVDIIAPIYSLFTGGDITSDDSTCDDSTCDDSTCDDSTCDDSTCGGLHKCGTPQVVDSTSGDVPEVIAETIG